MAVAAPATIQGPRTKNWFDLAVGDCLTEIPAIDLGAVTATLVDCATPHQAEVYLLAPLAVNTAIADVANQMCVEGFSSYTGQSTVGSPLTVTYLIDSNQDRTSNNPRQVPPSVSPSRQRQPHGARASLSRIWG
jgi:hypothetical protein